MFRKVKSQSQLKKNKFVHKKNLQSLDNTIDPSKLNKKHQHDNTIDLLKLRTLQ